MTTLGMSFVDLWEAIETTGIQGDQRSSEVVGDGIDQMEAMVEIIEEVEEEEDLFIPDIITFAVDPHYLNRPGIYPRQGTLLKLMFLGQSQRRDGEMQNIFTAYDVAVINEWVEEFKRSGGKTGIQPDIWERIEQCKREGRKWFREVLTVIGRRGSKGYIGAIAGAYVLFHYLKKGNPQEYYGVDKDKRISALVFAGKKDQAKGNQWRDLVNVIEGAPCFEKYINKPLGESLTINTAADKVKMTEYKRKGRRTERDMASIEIIAKESTQMAGRGPTGFMQFYDEMAHVVNTVARADATLVYEAATPALAQFGVDAFIYEPSSPWQKIGKFYENYEKSLERVAADGISEGNAKPSYPEMLMLQLESWRLYEDWEISHEIMMLPRDFAAEISRRPENAEQGSGPQEDYSPQCGGKTYKKFDHPLMAFDHSMKQLERANPESFRVEYRSQWAAVLNAYLNPVRIEQIWQDWQGRKMEFQTVGRLNVMYKAHGDPSKSGANFGWAIGHIEYPPPDLVLETEGEQKLPERVLPHVVFDVLHAWIPGDFPENEHEIDYRIVEADIKSYMDAFQPEELSFDQFNSILTMQNLREHVLRKSYPKNVAIFERTATNALNWEIYETFKTALNLGLVHAPHFDLAELELTFLQDLGKRVDHPTSGPVQTKDVADCMAIVTWALIGEKIAAYLGEQLGAPPHAALSGGVTPFGNAAQEEAPFDPARQMADFNSFVGERSRERRGMRGTGGRVGGPDRYRGHRH